MAENSTQKKIQRVQRAGVTRTRGQRRPLGFPLAVGAILILGTVGVFLARESNKNAVAAAPQANQDHWHMAFGIYVCDAFLPNQPDGASDPNGIHTHIEDGLIHVHPFGKAYAGKNATFQKFADQINLQLTDDSFTTSDGVTHKNGDKCNKKDDQGADVKDAQGNVEQVEGKVKMYVWPPQASDLVKPTVVTSDFGAQRFDEDGKAFVLAFVPDDFVPKLPPNLAKLETPSDQGQASNPTQSTVDTGSVPASLPEVTVPGSSIPSNTAPASPPTT